METGRHTHNQEDRRKREREGHKPDRESSSRGNYGGGSGGGYGGGSRDSSRSFSDRPRTFSSGPREMHKAKCSECGKDCEVPFKPTEGKPVYCRECFSKRRTY